MKDGLTECYHLHGATESRDVWQIRRIVTRAKVALLPLITKFHVGEIIWDIYIGFMIDDGIKELTSDRIYPRI